MSEAQQKLRNYVQSDSDFTVRCLLGMLETGELKCSDFAWIDNGERWLRRIEKLANDIGVPYPCK